MGDVHPETGKIYWGKQHGGKPYFCTPEKFKEKAEKNRIRVREISRRNPEKNAAKLKAWREAHPERYRECRKARERRPDVVEKRKEYSRMRYINDPDYLKRQMDWVNNNPEKRREIERRWRNKYYRENPIFRLRVSIATRLTKVLKRNKFPKTEGTLASLGCSIEFLRLHIERKFLPGMSWENYAWETWHVDHITPCALAKSPEELRALFHYTNLRPMWGPENIAKSDFLPDGTRARHRRKPLNSYAAPDSGLTVATDKVYLGSL